MSDADKIWGDIVRHMEWYADIEKRILAQKKKRQEKEKEGKK